MLTSTATPLPPLEKSDHNLVHLQPKYVPIVRRSPTTNRTVRRWSPEVEAKLQDCFNCTDWNILLETHGDDIGGASQCLTDYMTFCRDVVVPVKTERCYPNNRPWITSKVKEVLNRKTRAFKSGVQEEIKRVQRELKLCLREAKEA